MPERKGAPWYVAILYPLSLTPLAGLVLIAPFTTSGAVVSVIAGTVIFIFVCAANWYPPLRRKVNFCLTLQKNRGLAYAWAEPTLYALNGLLVFVSGILILVGMQFINETGGANAVSNGDQNHPVIHNLEEYDARLASGCAAEQSDKQHFSTCAYTLLLNDEMAGGDLQIYAEQEQRALDQRDARAMPNAELRSQLLSGLSSNQLDTQLGIEMLAYYTDFKHHRKINDPEIDSLVVSAVKRYGPCWGIPVGQCRE